MGDSFLRRIRILEMLTHKEDGYITIPEIMVRLSNIGFDINHSKTIERDMVYLSSLFNIGCDSNRRPFQWWWAEKNSIEIPGMGKNTALIFYLTQHYLEPLLPKSSLNYLKPKFRQSKIVLSGRGKENERNWIKKIRVIPKAMEQIPAPILSNVNDVVYESLYKERVVNITYLAQKNKIAAKKRIHPLGLIYRGITTELIAQDENDKKIKRFLMNRIQSAKIQVQSSTIPDGFKLDDYIKTRLGYPLDSKLIKFQAWISQKERHKIEESPLSKDQLINEAENNSIIVTATVRKTTALIHWILSMGPELKVLKPIEIKNQMKELSTNMYELYKS